ncbi:MAG: hypothetical protein HY538_01395 [Deltaproteobacteria bacterium]|nr:hypothetical protein [Deltaproteobacteria bacterium]
MAKAKAKTRRKTQLNNLVRSIGKIIAGRDGLARQAEEQYTVEVENILLTQSRDARRIQELLDGILDFCFDPSLLGLYKKLCRYYYNIDPVATASYVYAYRDMWEDGDLKKSMTAASPAGIATRVGRKRTGGKK